MPSWLFFADSLNQPIGRRSGKPGATKRPLELMDDRRVVPLTLLAQAGASLAVAAALWWWRGEGVATSALLGGAAAVVPNGFLAARLLAPRAGTSARALLQSAWIGEIGKILLIVLAFGVIFGVLGPSSPLAVFGGFIAAQAAVVLVPLIDGMSGLKKAVTKS